MFFLKYLFVQYKTEVGPSFGSRFMKAAGNLFMGKPESKGLGHVRQDLQDTYYYTQADRQLPPAGSKDLEEWQEHSILASQFRELEAPAVSKAVWQALTVFALLAVAVAAPFNGSVKSSGSVIGVFSSKPSDALPQSFADCVAINEALTTGKKKKDDYANFQAIENACTRLALGQ